MAEGERPKQSKVYFGLCVILITNTNLLKNTVEESWRKLSTNTKLALKVNRSIGSWVIHQNDIACCDNDLLKFQISMRICLRYILKVKLCYDSAQNVLNVGLRCSITRKYQ